MKKGDDRKERILETAERLFYEKGYEQTSIQDILDELKLSKGGFYHHFESKQQLVEAMCQKNAANVREVLGGALERAGDPISRLNALFDICGLWRRELADYSLLMLRAAYRADNAQLRERLRACAYECARPALDAIIRRGVEAKVFHTRYIDEIGEVVLRVYLDFMDEAALIIAGSDDVNAALASVFSRVEVYRHSIELLLNAPYGSVALTEVKEMREALIALAERNRKIYKS